MANKRSNYIIKFDRKEEHVRLWKELIAKISIKKGQT